MSEASQGPVVVTAAGAVQGRAADGVHAFLGVPYAAAPRGTDLMRPPEPVRPWSGTRQATEHGPTSPKGWSGCPRPSTGV